ncbi:MAG: ATPase, T2SS/T4P/T4SS family [Thaumarchaeota archaeon]|nr:ATPase, T2SS/T4P/T4SS family [Nitrososphaerota archaeon]
MPKTFESLLFRITKKGDHRSPPPPLLVELFERPQADAWLTYESYPFKYQASKRGETQVYAISCTLGPGQMTTLRKAVAEASLALDPGEVEPLTFGRLIEVLTQLVAEHLDRTGPTARVKELAELGAYEAIGLPRVLAFAKDQRVTEFFVDSDSSPVYLDHIIAGRCESGILLTSRERNAIGTHLDTFRGYTLDYLTPSLKNDIEVSGARLRISLDLQPICVNRFALDVRRLNVSTLSLRELMGLGVISGEAAAFLVGWLESGGNCTIIGETGTGKTTLLNALDEQVEPRFRRLYIEDVVETRDLLSKGYHQMKVKVDPYERGGDPSRTKESEIVKALHRSPDIVILSEIQTEEHSRAFFHSLSAGAKGIQTFHASSIEQAIGRWVNMHRITEQSLLDLGVLVQMVRPDRLNPGRYVQRICEVVSEGGSPRIREVFLRDREFELRRVGGEGWLGPPAGSNTLEFLKKVGKASRRLRLQDVETR